MKQKAFAAIRMLTGSYTPFALTYWDKEERLVAENWIKGASFPGAVEKLESEFAAMYGPEFYIRTFNLGRSAMQIALQAMVLPQGSEVLVPTFSCLGVVLPVIQAGLVPVLVDVDENFNLRYESVMEAMSPATRAIILPHLSGCWARDAERIIAHARREMLWIIEDAAQAQGLTYNDCPAGTFGDVGIFSANGAKMIFSSGGGWLVTRNQGLAANIRSIELKNEPRQAINARLANIVENYSVEGSEQGRRRLKQAIEARASKGGAGAPAPIVSESPKFQPAPMSGLDARLILFQLPKLKHIIAKRRENSMIWLRELALLPVSTMRVPPANDNVFTKFLLSFHGPEGEYESGVLNSVLLAHGIETEPSYIPLHHRPPHNMHKRTTMDFADNRWKGAFSVPVRPNLEDADWKRIRKALRAAMRAFSGQGRK